MFGLLSNTIFVLNSVSCLQMVYDLMNTILGEKMVEPEYSRNEIGNLFIIDRSKLTPLKL